MIWNCGNCGAELEEGTNFCPSCGTKINWETSQTDQTFTCGNCGREFNGKVGFCPHCGSPIIWDDKEKERLTLKQKIILLIAILISIVNFILYFNNWISNIVLGSYTILAPLIPLFIWLYKDEIKNNLNLKMKHTVYCYFSINIVILVFLSSLAIYNKVNTNYSPQESEEIAAEKVKVVEKESEAERQAREQKEEAERQAHEQAEKENKKKEILEQAQKAGYEKGFTVGPSSYITDDPKYYAKLYYTSCYGAPTSSEEKELYETFVSIFVEAYEEGHKAQQ